MPDRARVAVFGASGAVGGAIVEALRWAPDLAPVAVLRRPLACMAGVQSRLARLDDPRSMTAALHGCDFAVNAVGGPPATLRASAAAVGRAAQDAGIARLVHVSSMAVYGDQQGLLDETAAFAARPTAYEAAKIDSETILAHAVGLDAVILRPGLVFGAGSVPWAQRIGRLLRARRLGDLGGAGDGFCNLTHEADLCAATLAALRVPGAAGLAFNVASVAPLTWNLFLEMFARALGAVPVCRIGRRRLLAETRVLAPALQVVLLGARRAKLPVARLPEPIPPSLRRLFAQRLQLDPDRTDRILAIRRTPDRDGIVAAASVLRAA